MSNLFHRYFKGNGLLNFKVLTFLGHSVYICVCVLVVVFIKITCKDARLRLSYTSPLIVFFAWIIMHSVWFIWQITIKTTYIADLQNVYKLIHVNWTWYLVFKIHKKPNDSTCFPNNKEQRSQRLVSLLSVHYFQTITFWVSFYSTC